MSWRKVSPSRTVRYRTCDYKAAPGHEGEMQELAGKLVWVAPSIVSRMIKGEQHFRIAVFINSGYHGWIGYLYHREEQLITTAEEGFRDEREDCG